VIEAGNGNCSGYFVTGFGAGGGRGHVIESAPTGKIGGGEHFHARREQDNEQLIDSLLSGFSCELPLNGLNTIGPIYLFILFSIFEEVFIDAPQQIRA